MFTCLLRGRSTPEMRAIDYPCLCLCFEFSQITRTTPLRCTILHLSQIFLTDALTFIMSCLPSYRSCGLTPQTRSFISVHDASPRKVIRGKFHRDLVSSKNLDEILAHSAGNVCE